MASSQSLAARRRLARALFRRALARLAPAHLLREAVAVRRGCLECRDAAGRRFALRRGAFAGVTVLALGKAAGPMLEGWYALWRAAAPGLPLRAIAVVPRASGRPRVPGAEVYCAGHPLPDAVSWRAARALLAAARRETGLLVVLLSGGGSALAEYPLAGAAALPELRQLYRALVECGAPIGSVNVIRKHLSALKGGRLAAAAAPTPVLALILSDVPAAPAGRRGRASALDAVASGPTLPDASTARQCAALMRRWLPPDAAARARALVARLPGRRIPETPKAGDPALAHAHALCIGDNRRACATLAELAAAAGLDPVVDHTADEWEYRRAAAWLLRRWRGLRRRGRRVCLIAGGEVRVRVTRAGGCGGRNQALALRVAAGLGDGDCFLSAGTDGVDGNSPAAGALVDATTPARARRRGFDAARSLAAFDAWPLLAATGDAIVTGPTGNNLRDLRLFL